MNTRADCCGARVTNEFAKVQYEPDLTVQTLTMCDHHSRKHSQALEAQGFFLVAETRDEAVPA